MLYEIYYMKSKLWQTWFKIYQENKYDFRLLYIASKISRKLNSLKYNLDMFSIINGNGKIKKYP